MRPKSEMKKINNLLCEQAMENGNLNRMPSVGYVERDQKSSSHKNNNQMRNDGSLYDNQSDGLRVQR